MFGGLTEPSKPKPRPPPDSIPYVINVLGTKANTYGHVGPYAASQYRHRLMLYKQRKREYGDKKEFGQADLLKSDFTTTLYMKHGEKQMFKRDLNKRVDIKLKEYEENLEERRKELQELIWKEEREHIREAVDCAQHARDDNLQEMKIRTQQLRAKRETERLEVVKEKKLQQYLARCEEFRPMVAKRRLCETKEAQKMQISENEIRRQSEREIEYMWYQMLMKEIESQKERENQDNLTLRKHLFENKTIWDLQCKALQLQREDKVREVREDAIRLNNLKEELIREEIAALDEKRRKRDKLYREIVAQIQEREDVLAKQAADEKTQTRAFEELQLQEIERERGLDQKERLRNEMLQYRDYIERLDEERNEEERRIDELVQQELKEIQMKQDQARCQFQRAREALLKDVMEGRKVQLEYKRQEAEEQLKMKQAENQFLALARDHNERIRAEYARRQLLAAKQYEDDLKKQMEYSKLLKEREKEEIDKMIKQGQAEEEEYKTSLLRIINTDVKLSEVHPFRKVINREKCPCPKNLY